MQERTTRLKRNLVGRVYFAASLFMCSSLLSFVVLLAKGVFFLGLGEPWVALSFGWLSTLWALALGSIASLVFFKKYVDSSTALGRMLIFSLCVFGSVALHWVIVSLF